MHHWFPIWDSKSVNSFHIWSQNVSMVSTFWAQIRQWFPHWKLTLRDLTEIVLDTIDTFELQMRRPLTRSCSQCWRPLTRLGSKCGNHWHVWIPKVETIDAFGFRISTVKVTFAKLSPAQFQQQFSSAGLSLVLLSALDHPPNPPPTRNSSFTQSLARIYHWSTCESWSTTRWHLFDLIGNCQGPNHK